MSPRHWAVVPAAGVGRRMGADIPKQYLPLAGGTVLDHTLGRLLDHPRIAGVYLALSPEDGWWTGSRYARDRRVVRVDGGAERCHSVRNALEHLASVAAAEDWVLVHDAARPCLSAQDLERLIQAQEDQPVGGLLGMPVRDTMKRTDAQGQVLATVEREHLWHAFTPQMFRLGLLRAALGQALAGPRLVTDEAAAMELAGHRPLMVEGSPGNIKITRPEDLELAAYYLRRQGREG